MEKTNIIFETNNFEIFWQGTGGDNKGVRMKCKALNPSDGMEYEKYAGWVGKSLALHAGVKTPGYIINAACDLLADQHEPILEAIIQFLESNGKQSRADDFKDDNGNAAGKGVDHKTAHPFTEYERQKVRKAMQSNAPTGTNHM